MKFYQRLLDIREDHDMTQKEIAELLHTTQPQYARYEAGERELPMHHFITLAKYYNISLDYLAGLTDTPKPLYSNN
ncbi:MAG: helix-turn-helix transcriptional regulator [Clostridia bacterium]|nr:helix-turn-helix transcriptional regulator [Clostridia bacterium]